MSIEALPSSARPIRSDAELALATSAGCAEAYAELHRRYFTRLVLLCRKRTGDRALAEDVAQETMLRVLRFLPDFDVERELWPWIAAIAVRQCSTATRFRDREYLSAGAEELEDPMGDQTEDVLDHVAAREALKRIPDRQRLALTLRYIDDLDRDEAAQVIGVKRNAFDQLLQRGRVSFSAEFTAETALRLLGLLPLGLLSVRRLFRRATDSMGSVGVAAGPLLGATLAAVAGFSSLVVLQPRLDGGPLAQVATKAAPFEASWREPVQHRTAVRLAAHSHSSRPAPDAAVAVPAQISTYVSQTPLSAGTVAASRITVPTPVGVITVGSRTENQPGEDAVCALPVVRCT